VRIATARLPTVPVRGLDILIGDRLVVVVASGILFPPVGVFGSRVDLLGDGFAGVAASYAAGNGADDSPDRTSYAARSRPRGGASGSSPEPSANRMGPRLASNRV